MKIRSYSAFTHQGPYLETNEDGYDFDFENDIYLVMDGFGGSGFGDKAVSNAKENIKNFYTKIAQDPNATMPLYYNPRNLLEGNALVNSLMSAHTTLYQENNSKNINQRAGISLITAVKAESILILMSVGNCCAYQYRRGNLLKVINEDSYSLLSTDNFGHKFKNFPMNALGMYHEISFQLKEVRLAPMDKIILLTDGISSFLSQQEIQHVLSGQFTDDKERINSLLKLSNSRGNLDNQTAMILEF